MRVTEMAPMIHPIIVPTKSSLHSFNFYLIEKEDTLILVDAGAQLDKCWEHFLETLNKHHFAITDLDAIVLTHSHADHIGIVNRIQKVHPVPIYAHPNAVDSLKRDPTYLKKRITFFEKLYETVGDKEKAAEHVERLHKAMSANRNQRINAEILPLKEGDFFYGFNIFDVFGHAQDHIALFHEATGNLFAGDHILPDMPSNALIERGNDGKRSPSLQMYEFSLKKISHLPLKVIYPGHGNIIYHPDEQIDKNLARIERNATRLLQHLDKPMSVAELAKAVYQDKYDMVFSLVISEVLGHLERLEKMHKVTKERKGKVYYYTRV